VEANVNSGKRFVRRGEVPRLGEFALRIRVIDFQGFLTSERDQLSGIVLLK
jgi:hypothetical protein